ncbi:MAG: cupin domain-containing protein [Gaiellaceae bacterium]
MSRGPVWGAASEELNATILVWPAGEGPAEHVNDARDVLYVVIEGSARLTVDGDAQELVAGEAIIVDKGAMRALVAGPDGVRYATAHLRRGGLQVKSPRTSPS